MVVKIIDEKTNDLMDRNEIDFQIEHEGSPTPSRDEALEELSEEIGVQKGLIVIEKISTPHGSHVASGIARVYDSRSDLEEIEPHYLLERTGIADIEVEETVEETEETEEEEEPEEAEREEEIEKEPEKEEIDYEEISEKTISEIKEVTKKSDVDYEKLLEAEKNNKDRKTLKKWLKKKIE